MVVTRTTFLLLLFAFPAAWAADAPVDFAAQIEPLFHQKCYVCHSKAQQMNGLRLDRREAALKGGYSGPVIIPGDSAASKLIERVTSGKEGFRMPPVGEPLKPEEIALLRVWIDQGAQWPEPSAAPPEEEADAARGQHWSFQPIERPRPPEVRSPDWVKNPIDRFILAKLEAEAVEPSPAADRATLIRRVSFDLTGLPPTPEEVDAFAGDSRPGAYERLVGRLLDSPHFGERWAIGWLDAARYADSDGYERDPLRPHAWRWRHWVISAINRDMPFDQFTIEQIAGDLLPGAALEQRVATGFLRNGIKNREAGVKNEEKRFEEVIDRINTVGTAWMGLTVGCAQCHDHKYDPLSQKEFYELYAVFNNAVERDIDAPLPGEFGPFMISWPQYRAERQKILEQSGIPELYQTWRARMIEAMDNPGVSTDWDHSVTEWRAANDRADWLLRTPAGQLAVIEHDKRIDWFLSRMGPDFSKDEALKEKISAARENIESLYEQLLPRRTMAYTMIEREKAVTTHIALRGDWRAQGLEVQPGVPAVLHDWEPQEKPARLAFAEWLVSPENPLTARATVNRWWQSLFGTGLVRTANDFGTQGEPPSHPRLLDWLAAEFIDSGWSRKAVIRKIVTSATYRQSAAARPELEERDPGNRWLARQNRLRLPAELIRDNALAVSGLLNPEIGGPSVHPPQPEGIAELSYSKKAWPEDKGPERYRRGMYIFFRRTSPYPMLTNFDAPGKLLSTVSRERSNTPLQALNLLNDPVFTEAAQALALRVLREEEEFNRRLERMFRLCLGREPAPAEKDRLATYFARQKAIFEKEPGSAEKIAPFAPPGAERVDLATWTAMARGFLNLDEFLTRE